MSASRAALFFVLLIVASTLFDCSASKALLTASEVESPAETTILHRGMTWKEVIESIGMPIYDTRAFQNKFGQLIEVSEFALFRTDKDRSAGKKTHYRLYFYERNGEYQLVHWAKEEDWNWDEAILKKTRFK